MLAAGPTNNQVQLEREIPVHVTYFTAVVGEGGQARYTNDVYGHELRLTQALARTAGRRSP